MTNLRWCPRGLQATATAGRSLKESITATAPHRRYTHETTSFTVTKVWDDNSDQDSKRDNYAVQLYADGDAYGNNYTPETTGITLTKV